MLKIDGFDSAVIGTAMPWNNKSKTEVLIYDGEMIVEILMADGMSDEEAREHIEFNIEGAYMGEDTPVICWKQEDHVL